jgi:hypothetical protein
MKFMDGKPLMSAMREYDVQNEPKCFPDAA